MAFAFALTDRDAADGVRRIAREELQAALAELDAAEPPADLVHGLRKHVKKLRGLLRLVRPNFPGWAAEDTALRDAARGISGLRDAEVLRATLSGLAAKAPPAAAPAIAHFAARLDAHHATTAGNSAEAMAAYRETVAQVIARIPDWQLRGKAFNLLEDGLITTWEKVQKRRRAFGPNADPEAVHALRKRVKDHWYQARLLAPIWPELLDPYAKSADDLGELLGEHHDVSVFRTALAASDLSAEDRATLDDLARKQLKKIERKSARLLDRQFAGSAPALAERWGIWWKVWRAR